MPEGPQMVFLKEQAQIFLGQRVLQAAGDTPHFPLHRLAGQTLSDIQTFGKELLFCFPGFAIRIHLMLFGKYVFDGHLNRALRLGLEFETGEINFYACDCRMIDRPLHQVYDWSTDVMHPAFDRQKALQQLILKPRQLICEALLNQQILAGVGNGIKNEALFRCRIHPESQVEQIPQVALLKLIQACTDLSFEYLDCLREGTENDLWQVYRQKQCPRDRLPLQQQKIGKTGRTSYFCDKCQTLYLPD